MTANAPCILYLSQLAGGTLARIVVVEGEDEFTHAVLFHQLVVVRRPAARAVGGRHVVLARREDREPVEDRLGDDQLVRVRGGGRAVPDSAMLAREVDVFDRVVSLDRAAIEPDGRAIQLFEAAAKLSRRQQQKIVEVLELLVRKHESRTTKGS